MITIRVFEITLNIIDYIEFYLDEVNNILESVKKLYLNRCFMGCLIIDIVKILKYSACIIDNTSGMGSVNVQFSASVVQYVPNEIIVGCAIVKHTEGSLICSNKYANIVVSKHKLYSAFKEGNLILVKVINAKYSINHDKIKVIAECYTGFPECIKFTTTGEVNKELLPPYLPVSKDTNWIAFNNIMSKYVNPPRFRENTKTMNIDDIVNLKGPHTIWRDRALDLAKPEVCVSTEIDKDCISLPITNVMIALINDYNMYVSMIDELTTIFTVDALRENPNLMKLLKTIKVK